MALDASALESREALEAAIIEQYESDEERDAARAVLGSVTGIDFETGMSIDEEPGAAADADKGGEGGDNTRPAGSEEGRLEDLLPEMGDPEAEAKRAAKEKEGGGEDDEETPEAKALRERDEEIADLRAQLALKDSDSEIRTEVSDKMRERLAEQQTEDSAEDARVKEFEDTYGEDAAKPLRDAVAARRALRDADNQRFEEEQTEQARATKKEELSGLTEVEKAIRGNADLLGWRNEAAAFNNGDTTKSADNFNLAVSIDQALRESPQWAGKPIADRFAEAVKMVKLSTGALSAGAPDAQKGKTEQQIADEIARKATTGRPSELPGSISDIDGGAAPEGLEARLETMSAAEIADLDGLTPAAIDDFLARREAAAEAGEA